MQKTILFLSLIILFITACKNKTEQSSSQGMADTAIVDDSEAVSEDLEVVEKNIEWADGNVYTYTETETLSLKDSVGNERIITVYKTPAPAESIINCNIKRCKWCGREENARGITVREYPNLDALRGSATYSDLLELASVILMNSNEGMSFLSMMMGNKSINAYFDLENNKIRTEWKTECHYNGPSDFCSLKCENEYNNR